ncbi:MAG: hypothetical protein ACREEW_04355 [Caulobacteraceae bacterium]
MEGVEEDTVEFQRPIELGGADRFRRIAGIGPVYEALAFRGPHVRVRIVETDEEFDYPRDEAELDPPA